MVRSSSNTSRDIVFSRYELEWWVGFTLNSSRDMLFSTYGLEWSSGKRNVVVVELSVIFESSAMWVVIEAVGTAVEALGHASGTVTKALELVVDVLCLSTANQVLSISKRP